MQRSLHKIIKGNRLFGTAIKHSAFGVPKNVLTVEETDIDASKIGGNEVALKFLASPINPSDLNMVEGVYGIKPKLPAVGGNEGVAVVTSIGAGVKKFEVGDWVIPFRAGFGCWRTEAIAAEGELIKVAKVIPRAYAATLAINPSTAYRLLRDFETLKAGDVIMQNGANSMVGLAVIQMAKVIGVKTINIVRSDRPHVDDTLSLLSTLGGDINIVDTQLNTPFLKEILAELPPCKLAFNCVGGDSTTDMARCLAPGGTLVTYGGMSKRTLTLPTELVVYNQLKVKGFWIATSDEERGIEAKQEMINDIVNMIRMKQLAFFYEMHDFDDFDYALEKSTEPFLLRKIVLDLDHPDRLAEHDKRMMKRRHYFKFETHAV
jgi:mitochondrial enoyl-[acyl-carrier protein] reductase / trans-2-enoyl-CoA reductase